MIGPPRSPGSLRRVLLVVAVLAAAGLLTGCAATFGVPDGATEQGQEVNVLWRRFFITSLFVAGTVYGLILIAIVVFRRRRGDDTLPRQSEGNVPLEIVYTAIPVLIVIVLWIFSYTAEEQVLAVADDPDVVVDVTGFAWGWRFAYPDETVELVSAPNVPGPQMVLPVDRTTRIRLTSDDVIHSFYVPEFLFKRDAIPGRTWEFDLTPERTGTYHGACAEFCGLNHAFMDFSVKVVEQSVYERWTEQAAAEQRRQEAAL